ncbi:MAG: hypothetical protein LBR32_08905, partial [Propionibacteriaceae bacterium]|nr:hypothetical protein [Propionibacteriaceae bacterium]
DDIWLAGKVEWAAAAITDNASEDPVLYCGRSYLTDESLKPCGVIDPVPKGPSLANALVQNIAPGHTMAMNAAMVRLAAATLRPGEVVMHDCWLYLVAAAVGHVIVDQQPHAYYRQHSGNEEGYRYGRLARAVNELRRLGSRDRSEWTRQAQALLETVGPRLKPADLAQVQAFLTQDTIRSRLRYLRRYGFVYQVKRLPLAAMALYGLGRYRVGQASLIYA